MPKLSNICQPMNYREPLPEGCPPDAAEDIIASQEFFRLVRTNPPTEEDFLSQRAKNPHRNFSRITECQARGLSIFSERADSQRALKLPNLRGCLICRVMLEEGAGPIQQTGQHSHHTWWPLADFDILAHCIVETP